MSQKEKRDRRDEHDELDVMAEDGLAASGGDVLEVLGRSGVEPDLAGELAGELTHQHGKRLAVLA